jgi:hypothetical protein
VSRSGFGIRTSSRLLLALNGRIGRIGMNSNG